MNTFLGARVRGHMLACFALIFTTCATVRAQSYVEGVSEVLPKTTSTDLYTLTSTYITYDLAAYYSPSTCAQLLDNGNVMARNCTPPTNGQNAELDGHVANLKTGDDYEIDGAHSLTQLYTYYDPGSGNSYYENPGQYGFTDGYGSSDYDYTGGGGDYYTVESDIFLGYTAAAISTAVPQISGISPAGAAKSASGQTASGQITVSGSHLVDVFDGGTTPTVLSGSGLSLATTGTPSANAVTLNYSIDATAATGARQFTLTNRFGQSEPQTFTIGDPSPMVGEVEPHVWPAGSVMLPLTITGSGFGTSPTVTIAGVGVLNPVPAVTSSMDGSIHTTVSIATNAPSGPATVTVQSHGSGGNGFVQGTPGQSSLGVNAAAIQAFTAPPTINLLNGTTNSPVAGQLISLSLTPPSGLIITSQTWTFSNYNHVVSGYTASTSSGTVTPVDALATQSDLSYYYIVPGQSETVSVSVTYDNLQSASATATFNVDGPTTETPSGAFFTATPGTVNVWPAGVAKAGKATYPWLEFGNSFTNNGMSFKETAKAPQTNHGTFFWVQVLKPRSSSYRSDPSTPTTTSPGGLDSYYPYQVFISTPDQTNDSPGIELRVTNTITHLDEALGEAADVFSATMYLMWDPTLNTDGTTCSAAASIQDLSGNITSTASSCTGSIPVPVASVTWGYGGNAINTAVMQPSTNTNWLLCPCSLPQPAAPVVSPTTTYPTWTATALNTQ